MKSPPGRVERRLAAILAADVAGYSRLMEADEEGTLAALRAVRRELGDLKITEHRGRIVKTTGDGLLVEFASVVDAVRCALEIQREMVARNTTVPAGRRIEFRMGINVGDIMIEDGDIFGDGVNIAARLEALAEPGSICLSAAAHEQVRDRLDITFNDLGEQQVKNITRPVGVFCVTLTHPERQRREAGAGKPGPALPEKPSIAVLPFQNLTSDPEQDYFADGMVEEMITGLSRIKWLFVIARNSTFVYKGKSFDVKQVGEELGVRYVLEGGVRGAAGRVRITGQLVETESRKHIWAERYDRALDDVFALQDEITLSVVGAIEPSLRQAEIERVRRKRPEDLDAYDLVLRARPYVDTAMPEGALKALPLLRRALALEPDYALAHGHAARCHHQPYVRAGRHAEDRQEAIWHARAAACTRRR
jgi:adenylate cyclase